MRQRLLFACIVFAAASFIGDSAADGPRPWVGEPGIRRSMADIKAAEARQIGPKKVRVHREHERPRENLPQNPQSKALSAGRNIVSPRGRGSAKATGQTLSTTFDGPSFPESGSFPPDTMGAVGPSQFIVAINGRFRSYNKATGNPDGALDVDPDVFFAPVLTPPGFGEDPTYTTDPRIRFDRLSGRWIIIMIDVTEKSSNQTARANRVLLAVSDGSVITATTNWTFFFFQQDVVAPAGDTGNFADYPTLGIDANACYIGVAQFTPANDAAGTSGFVVRKSSILGGGPIVVTAFRGLAVSDIGPENPQGVDNFDPNPTVGYFVGADYFSFGRLVLRKVTDPGGNPSISDNIPVTVPATSAPQSVPHLGNVRGTNGFLDAVDDRLMNAVLRNGHIWTAHTINVSSSGDATGPSERRAAVRWYDIQDPGGTPSLQQSGTIFDPTPTNPLQFWIPTLTVSGQGHTAIGFSVAGATSFIDAGTSGRLAADALSSMSEPLRYTASTTPYNPPGDVGDPESGGRRWGDYSFTSMDPEDDMTMWTIQQYCNANNSWGLRVARLVAPPPATPAGCSPATLIPGAVATLQVTGTSSNGSGFFDPGAGFSRHLTAQVSGTGVTVNSVTYVDPTHVIVNVSVAADAPGDPRTITIINPDGQAAVSSSPILFINAAVDSDGDGMSDDWESTHGLNPADPGDGVLDADGDGITNRREFTADTDPQDSGSKPDPARLANISTRLEVGTDDRAGIGGFIITASDGPKQVIVRGIGPSLTTQNVAGALVDPVLDLFSGIQLLASNDDWRDSQEQTIIDSGVAPNDNREAAIVLTLDPGVYTAVLRGKGGTSGVGLVEVYDLQPPPTTGFANISTRGFVRTGDRIMIGGIILVGPEPATVLLRGIGPSLSDSGISEPLTDPKLDVFDGQGMRVASNDNWRDSQQPNITATTIPPQNDAEPAIVADLVPGNYTALLSGVNDESGVALIEAYSLR